MGWESIAAQVIGWAITAGMGAAVGALATRASKASARDAAMQRGMMAVMRSQLIDMHERYVVEGKPCAVDAKEQATDVYEAYAGLGGNGTGKHLYQEIMAAHVA